MTQVRLGKNFFVRRIEEISPQEVAAWDALLVARDDLRRAFLSFSYATAVSKSCGDVIVLVGYANGAPSFFMPLQRLAGPLGRLGVFEPAGGVMTDYFGAVAADGVQVVMADLLDASAGITNAVFFTHLDESQDRYGLKAAEQRKGLRTRLGTPAIEYWANLRKADKKLVYDTERRERKLVSEFGPISFEWSSSQPASDMAWLIESKKSQYTRTGKGTAPLYIEANVALMHRLLESEDDLCRGVLSVLRCGEEIVAAHFGLRCREMLHVWFPVYETKFASHSPGRILFRHMFLAGAERGIEVFDRGEGDSQAKRDFANEEHLFGRGLWLVPGMRGQVAHLALRIAWRIARWKG